MLVPHLYFNGQCEAALGFYASLGLGRIRALQRHEAGSAATHGSVLHAELEGPGLLLYAGDGADSEPMKGCALLLELTDKVGAAALFQKLGEGGRVSVAFGRKAWGEYGNLTDRFGVQWAILVRPDAR